MKLSDALRGLGRPVAYFPELARFFGSVDAAILFAQLFYWKDKASHDYQYQTGAKIEAETGLSVREQRKARALLVGAGILHVKRAPLQHETHYRILEDNLDEAWGEWCRAGKPDRLKLSRKKRQVAREADGTFKRVHNTAVRTSTIRRSGNPHDGAPGIRSVAAHPRDYTHRLPGNGRDTRAGYEGEGEISGIGETTLR